MRTVTIMRKSGYYGMIRKLNLRIDGEHVGAIRARNSVMLKIPDAATELCGAMDWATTEPVMLSNVKDGDTIIFAPYFTLNMAKNIGANFLPFKVSIERLD